MLDKLCDWYTNNAWWLTWLWQLCAAYTVISTLVAIYQ
jgi:hypothetical protein